MTLSRVAMRSVRGAWAMDEKYNRIAKSFQGIVRQEGRPHERKSQLGEQPPQLVADVKRKTARCLR
jgi:hypothetical protein